MSWQRILGSDEAAVVRERYEQLAERWRQRWPDEPIPPLEGDALLQIRTVQQLAHRLRARGEERPPGGLQRGPGMVVASQEERERIEQLEAQAVRKDAGGRTDGDSGS